MIARLSGTVAARGKDYVILDVAGVGYRVVVGPALLGGLAAGGTATLFTHEAVREDGRELFGFRSHDALELFWRLIAVPGVGPRVALHLMESGSPEQVRASIEAGDLKRLTSIPGIGTKKAQQIVLALKGKLVEAEEGLRDDLLDALVGMGYGKQEAAEALKAVPEDLPDEERLRKSLAFLKRK